MNPRSKWKTFIFASLVILTNSIGNFFVALGMKRLPVAPDTPEAFVKAIFSPVVSLGVGLLIFWLLARMMFMSFADLSYMLPITSLGYVASTLLGRFFLNETITTQRWGGTLLIMAGTLLVGAGKPDTTAAAAHSPGNAMVESPILESAAIAADELEHSAAAASEQQVQDLMVEGGRAAERPSRESR